MTVAVCRGLTSPVKDAGSCESELIEFTADTSTKLGIRGILLMSCTRDHKGNRPLLSKLPLTYVKCL